MTLLWDQHACLPLQPDADVDYLARFARSGPTYVSVNVGYSPQTFADSMLLIERFRAGIDAHPALSVARPADIVAGYGLAGDGRHDALADGIHIAFDLEDSNPLDGDLGNVARFVERGVATMLPSYNHANRAGCGCLDADDTGLTSWGRDLIAEMNAVGMVPDGSHCSAQTGLDMCAISTKPVIYSHSCMRAVWDHPRNITDDQARAAADTGGVIGITGVGIFLGPNTPTLEAMTRHLEYAVDLVGIDHVGISTDHSFDAADFLAEIDSHPEAFDDSYTRWGPIQWMAPEVFVTIGAHLAEAGWAADDIAAVLGGNFRRVAAQSWVVPRR